MTVKKKNQQLVKFMLSIAKVVKAADDLIEKKKYIYLSGFYSPIVNSAVTYLFIRPLFSFSCY